MGYGYSKNYGGNSGYSRGGGGNAPQNNGGYGQQQYNNAPAVPISSPEEFARERLDFYLLFLKVGEEMGLKQEELTNNNMLGGWISSYFIENSRIEAENRKYTR